MERNDFNNEEELLHIIKYINNQHSNEIPSNFL